MGEGLTSSPSGGSSQGPELSHHRRDVWSGVRELNPAFFEPENRRLTRPLPILVVNSGPTIRQGVESGEARLPLIVDQFIP